MKKKILLLTILLFIFLFSCKTEEKPTTITTVIIGEVINRPNSKKLLLTEKNADSRVNHIEIPITQGKFEYTLNSEFIKEYSLAFHDEISNGSWRPIEFFNDKDTIKMTLFTSDKADFNVVFGGELNFEKNVFHRKNKINFSDRLDFIYKTKFDSLHKIKKWETKIVRNILKELQTEKDGIKKNTLYKKLQKIRDLQKDLTPQARLIQNEIDSIYKQYKKHQREYIEKSQTLLGFSMLMDNLVSNSYDKEFNYFSTVESLEKFQKQFKNHPYTKSSKLLFKGIINSKIGGSYTDFSSKTEKDKVVKISPIVRKNNATLIDLWAPWCGPCISKSKKLKPEYKKLKEKGLEVFAVIGGINSKEKYSNARDKYNYPWTVNYELNKEFEIWDKYNITNSGGSQFLIDSKGKILSINPEPKEIDSILDSMKSIKL